MAFSLMLLAHPVEARVRWQLEEFTADFEGAILETILETMSREIGLRVICPSSLRGERVSLHVYRVPLERAIQQLVNALGLSGYVLLYNSQMQPEKLILAPSSRSHTSGAGPEQRPTAQRAPTKEAIREIEQNEGMRSEEQKQGLERLHISRSSAGSTGTLIPPPADIENEGK